MDIAVWADEATIEFLSYLSDRDFYKKYGLLVLLSRKEESSQAFEVFVDRNVVLGRLEKIDILPLTMEESTFVSAKNAWGVNRIRNSLRSFTIRLAETPILWLKG